MSALATLLASILLPAVLLFLFLKRNRSSSKGDKQGKKKSSLPLPPLVKAPAYPFIGHLWMFKDDPIGALRKLAEEMGEGIFFFQFGPQTAAIVTDFNLMEKVKKHLRPSSAGKGFSRLLFFSYSVSVLSFSTACRPSLFPSQSFSLLGRAAREANENKGSHKQAPVFDEG